MEEMLRMLKRKMPNVGTKKLQVKQKTENAAMVNVETKKRKAKQKMGNVVMVSAETKVAKRLKKQLLPNNSIIY